MSKPPDLIEPQKKRAQKWGRYGEFLARIRLMASGHRILAANFKTKVGEIDLITKKANTIGFVEVKARKTHEDAAYAVSEKQKQRIERAAVAFMSHRPDLNNCDMRFDVALVTGPLSIHILYDAWRP